MLRTPLPALVETSDVPAPLQPLLAAMETHIVHPLKTAKDDEAWAETLDTVLQTWLRIRLAITTTLIELEGEAFFAMLDDTARPIEETPLTLLPAPAHSAARFATITLSGIQRAMASALRRRRELNVELLEHLVEDIAIIELAWLTIAGPERPRASVAEAAAWEAYSRVRPLRASLSGAGLDTAELPTETPNDAAERAMAMLARLAHDWTDAEQAALDSARLPAGELQG